MTNGLTGVERTHSGGEIIGASGGKGATTGESWSGMVDICIHVYMYGR